MLLRNKNAVITGANRGIGRAILETFAKNGANIFACARTKNIDFEKKCEELERQNQVSIIPIYFDLIDSGKMKEAVKEIMGFKRPIDILVNNAGITYNALFQMTTADNLQHIYDVNYFAVFYFTQYILKLMLRNKKGSIVNISSSAALDSNSGRSAYGSSKASIICTTKAIAQEVGAADIRANCIAPGITDTDMVEESMTKEVIEQTIKSTNLKRIGKPQDIANAALFLASDLSSYVTGQVIRVDGGLSK